LINPNTLEDALSHLQNGEITAVQLVEIALSRVSEKESQLHGLITVTKEEALDQAEKIDKSRVMGESLGILAGIPITYKDVFFTQGIRSTAGSNVLTDFKPESSAAIVQILEKTGAISIGKANCHEFAFGSPSESDYFPAARNPWNINHMPGSSSSGSATSVAAAYCYASIGSDTGGSVRHPAAACGLVGLKPTRDLIPTAGLIPLASSLDTVGIITRNVRDNLITLCAAVGTQDYLPFLKELRPELPGLKIGVDFKYLEHQDVQEEVRTCFLNSLDLMRELGIQLISLNLPDLDQIASAANQIIQYEAWQGLKDFYENQHDALGIGLQQKLKQAQSTTAEDYQKALDKSAFYAEDVTKVLQREQMGSVDLIVSVGREAPAQTMRDLYDHPTAARSTCNRLYSLTGHPAITIPMGFGSNGMPLAIQIAGQYHDEYLLFQVAHAFEKKLNLYSGMNNVPWY
jgi:aspartyl-tRNA(Asn)/glutamyl-tRNA(Gln) amidotransferase subunit A